ncbi:hypothetical protein DRE_07779 [Drechslerella stenobrocha 248]|uniref:Uncharacterized protein n=1 Tax=Drechslerella stenobrocha 248 TaxID=1043628 RepID=W7I746_9PEZI|nr:hypothetical protein DRE_07779 [Drechslerella stenobrocha 248]
MSTPPRRPPPPTSRTPPGLPTGYRAAATKVTLIIVALPIAIVTSYLMYKRVVLGEEPRVLGKSEQGKKPSS